MNASLPTESAPAAYTDIAGLHAIDALGRRDRAAGLAAAARQFESFFVAQLLEGMRAANAVFALGNALNTGEMQFRQDMLDQQLSVSLTQGRGLGVADMLARQLQEQFGPVEARARLAAADGQRELDERRLDTPALSGPHATIPRSVRAALPTVVSSALKLLEPLGPPADDGERPRPFSGKDDFVRALLPEARRAASEIGVDPRVLIAQSALETGWGQSILGDHVGRSSNNLFNIKAGNYWEGPSVGVTTLEFSEGIPRPQRARFRAYSSIAESFADYVALLRGQPRYAAALANADDPWRFMRSLQQAGYATDPEYARKVIELLRDDAISGAG